MTQRELTFADYKAMLRRRWILIVVLALAGGPVGYGVSRAIPGRYTSSTTVLVEPPAISPDIIKPVVTSGLTEQLASMKAQILSRSRLEPLIRTYNLYPKDVNRRSMDELVERLRDSIDVSAMKEMDETKAQGLPGFTVAVTLDNPNTAFSICGQITSMFVADASNALQEKSQDTTDFLADRLADAKSKLDAQGRQVADFQRKYFGSLPEDQEANANQLASLDVQLSSVTQALAGAEQDRSYHESQLESQRSAWQSSQTGDSPDTLQTQLAKRQLELATLEGNGYTDAFPDVIQKKSEIAALQKKIDDAQKAPKSAAANDTKKQAVEPLPIQQLELQLNTDEKTITERTKERDHINQEIQECRARMALTPSVQQQYEELTRGNATANQEYQDLLKQQQTSATATALQKRQEGEQFQILDAPNLPEKPSFPNRALFSAAGFVLGLGLGLGLTFVIEIQDTSLRSERDIETALRLPVLAMIPPVEAQQGKKTRPTLGRALRSGART